VTVGTRERPTPVRVSRMQRQERRTRRRRALGLAVAVTVVVAAGAWFVVSRPTPAPVRRVPPPPAPVGEADSLLLAVRGAGQPLLAVIGAGGTPTALPIPAGLRIEAPGLGEMSVGDVARLPGEPMRTTISNALGMWVDHFAVTDLQRFGQLAARGSGLAVTLPQAVTIDARVLGPGTVRLDAPTLVRYLGAPGRGLAERWDVVLTALAAAPPALQQGDLLDTDDLGAASTLLHGAAGAGVETFPAKIVSGTVRVPDYGALDQLVAGTFGTSGTIVPVIVQNGSGAANVGQTVARAIVPFGFRIVLSQNDSSFDTRTTLVIANGKDQVDAASRAREALGVGTVEVSRVPSGIGDVTIDVGSDLSS
jgi:hypothetical protein